MSELDYGGKLNTFRYFKFFFFFFNVGRGCKIFLKNINKIKDIISGRQKYNFKRTNL